MSILINLVYLSLLVVTLPYWLYKSIRSGKYREGMWSRFSGRVALPADWAQDARPVVWLHGVSVGEIVLLRPLVARLAERRPDLRLVVSATTNTGYAMARQSFPNTPIVYAPLDFTWSARAALDRIQPALFVLAEAELWPNLLLECRRRNVAVAVANARLSERSHRRYARIAPLLRPALSAVRWWGAQTDLYAQRIRLLVGSAARVETTGSIKYDAAPTDRDNPRTQELAHLFAIRPGDIVWVAGSTMAPEEDYVVDAFEELRRDWPRLRLILVPRHKERFEDVAQMLRQRSVPFVRRSELVEPLAEPAPIVLLDTIGELTAAWGMATLGFVGGSLAFGRGGQSMIEPAGYGVPVCFGPHVWNFQDTVDRLIEAGAAVQLEDPEDLALLLRSWLVRPPAADAIGQKARRFILSQKGACDLTFAALDGLLPPPALRQSA